MKKIIIVVSIVIVIAVCTVIIVINNKTKIESEIKVDKEETVTEPKEIKIYDIEEGYLTVPYNPNANKNKYEWAKSLKVGNGYYKYEDDEFTSKFGIDVSEHQGEIDWHKVKQAGVEFAILRVGYRGYGKAGNVFVDKTFEQNYENAIKEGIEVGVYFFSQAINIDEVKEEAKLVLDNLKGKKITYPVVFDLEKIKNDDARTDNLTEKQITQMTLEFCQIIEKEGYTPSIYGNAKTFTTKMQLELFNKYNKWYADYQEQPIYPYEFDIWQYTETGKMEGIEGVVDLNIQLIKKK